MKIMYCKLVKVIIDAFKLEKNIFNMIICYYSFLIQLLVIKAIVLP